MMKSTIMEEIRAFLPFRKLLKSDTLPLILCQGALNQHEWLRQLRNPE